jgi:hypothetical protein
MKVGPQLVQNKTKRKISSQNLSLPRTDGHTAIAIVSPELGHPAHAATIAWGTLGLKKRSVSAEGSSEKARIKGKLG